MSFRELRDFCEVMRSLGYNRLISVENFRTPNFELVADVLDWLVHRFDPHCAVPDDISTEQDRVAFIKVICERVVLRTGLRLNSRKLYGADGYAVKELLRLATILLEAQRSVETVAQDVAARDTHALSAKLADLKTTRFLCSRIVESGASLFDLLQKESDVRPEREKALRFLDGMSRNLGSSSEAETVERAVSQLLSSHSRNLEQLRTTSGELQQDEKQLEQKIKKKKQELERCKKRLGSLVAVRPAFMDEYEQLETELESYYDQYVSRFRNLDYLEHEADALNRAEEERMEENDRTLRRMQKRLHDEEWRLLRGEDDRADVGRKPKKIFAGHKPWMPPSARRDGDGDGDGSEGSSAASAADSDLPESEGDRGGSDEESSGGRGRRGSGGFGGGRGGVSGSGSGSGFGGGLAGREREERFSAGGRGGGAAPAGIGPLGHEFLDDDDGDDIFSGSDRDRRGGLDSEEEEDGDGFYDALKRRPRGGSDFDF